MNGAEELRYEDSLYYEIAQETKKTVEMLLNALNKPNWLRKFMIKLIFPEIVDVANFLREEVFWKGLYKE